MILTYLSKYWTRSWFLRKYLWT